MQIATDAVASWSAARPEVTRRLSARRRGAFEVLAQGLRAARRVAGEAEAQSRAGARRRDDPARRAREPRSVHAASRAGRSTRRSPGIRRTSCAPSRSPTRPPTLVPGLTPTRQQVDAQGEKMQSDKDGIEVDQGIFFAHVLARPDSRHAFLPRDAAAARRSARAARRTAGARARSISAPRRSMRQGKAATVFMRNPRYLNAEDEATLAADRDRGRSRDPRSGERDRACCAATPSTIRNMPASACSRPASISPISTTARSPTSGT